MVYTTKTCVDCGVVMENCTVAQKRCPECLKIWTRIYRENYRERIKMVGVKPRDTQACSTEYCEGCDYFFGSCVKTCNYLFVTGHRRPCPPGKDCTVRKEKENGK